MNYELAKKLKDAGFPMPKKDGCPNCWGDLGRGCDDDCGKERYPTLSELIEACGESFETLCRIKRANLPVRWAATRPPVDYEVLGDTSEEAVASLWLALHQKDEKVVQEPPADSAQTAPSNPQR